MKSTKPAPATRPSAPPSVSRLLERVLSLPRWARIVMAGVFALALTLLLLPVIDGVYLQYFYSPETRDVAAYAAAAIGVVMYLIGWRLIVGFAGESPRISRVVLWYVSFGAAVSLIALALFAYGAVIGGQ